MGFYIFDVLVIKCFGCGTRQASQDKQDKKSMTRKDIARQDKQDDTSQTRQNKTRKARQDQICISLVLYCHYVKLDKTSQTRQARQEKPDETSHTR